MNTDKHTHTYKQKYAFVFCYCTLSCSISVSSVRAASIIGLLIINYFDAPSTCNITSIYICTHKDIYMHKYYLRCIAFAASSQCLPLSLFLSRLIIATCTREFVHKYFLTHSLVLSVCSSSRQRERCSNTLLYVLVHRCSGLDPRALYSPGGSRIYDYIMV